MLRDTWASKSAPELVAAAAWCRKLLATLQLCVSTPPASKRNISRHSSITCARACTRSPAVSRPRAAIICICMLRRTLNCVATPGSGRPARRQNSLDHRNVVSNDSRSDLMASATTRIETPRPAVIYVRLGCFFYTFMCELLVRLLGTACAAARRSPSNSMNVMTVRRADARHRPVDS